MHVVQIFEVQLRALVLVEHVDDGRGRVTGLSDERPHRPAKPRQQVPADDNVLNNRRHC